MEFFILLVLLVIGIVIGVIGLVVAFLLWPLSIIGWGLQIGGFWGTILILLGLFTGIWWYSKLFRGND